MMKKSLFLFCFIFSLSANATSRLKDLVTVKGVRDNPIIGYGLVIGLNGTGDGGGEITNGSLKKMYQRLGLETTNDISSKNVAAVVITANLPPFARIGQKIDVKVSSIGDASSLVGGTLLVTPMKGGDGKIYAIANGSLSLGGLKSSEKFATTGIIPSGATVESEIELNFDQKDFLRLSLKNPDFTTAARIEKVLNSNLGGKFATAKDSSTVDLVIPFQYKRKVVPLLAIIENFKVEQDQIAKIIINERTGTIVAGGDIQIKPVAISHGDLTIQIKATEDDPQANAGPSSIYFVDKKTTLNDLVKSLNAYGAKPEDVISIFQALKSNGALIGEIEII